MDGLRASVSTDRQTELDTPPVRMVFYAASHPALRPGRYAAIAVRFWEDEQPGERNLETDER